MCDRLQVLHHGPHGYVAECTGCARFRVAFGNVVTTLDEGELTTLAEAVRDRADNYRDRVCPGAKLFHFATEARGVALVFSHAELEQLDQMLSEARWLHGIYAAVTDPDA